MSFDLTKITNLQALQDLANRIQTKFNALQAADVSLKGVAVDGNALNFFTTTDTSTTPAFSIDLPAEMFLDSVSTGLVPNFTFSAATYTGATNPNLDGKPVLVLGVKTRNNDGVTETITYSFLDMTSLVDVYTASDTSIVINDYKIKANVSDDSDNMLATTANGLYVDGSGKVDKVTSATAGNIATFVAGGGISDTGIAIATNAEVNEMLDSIFGSSRKSVSFASTSDFFSTNSATFKSFLQSALAADSENNNDGGTEALSMFIGINDGDKASNVNITYGDLRALVASDTATFGNIVTLINDKLGELETDERVEGAASFSNGAFTFTENENADSLMFDITGGAGATGNYILKSLYDNTEDTSAFEVDGDSYTLSLVSA